MARKKNKENQPQRQVQERLREDMIKNLADME